MFLVNPNSTEAAVNAVSPKILKNHLELTNQPSVINKQKSLKFIFMMLLLVSSFTLTAYDKYSSVKIYLPQNPEDRLSLLGLLEIDHFHEHDGYFMADLDAKAMAKLKTFKCKYEIIAEDAVAELVKQNNDYYSSLKNGNGNASSRVAFEQNGQTVGNIIQTPAAFQVKSTLGGYYSFAEMNAAMDALVAAYPTLAQKFSIGTTVEGRTMWCIKISDNVATDETDEPELLYMGLHHAREAIGGASMIFLMQYLCEQYSTNTNIKDLVDNREFFIIVCANPDGWEYNRSTNPNGGGQWRKNRKNNGNGTFGVDLNRNWGIDWANCNGALGSVSSCGSSSGSSDVYWGASAFSEPETQNLRNFVQSREFAVCMDQHSVGPYYSLPFGRLTRSLTSLDNQVYTQMTSVMGKYNGMRYGNTYQTLGYEVSGGMKDWLLIGDSLNIGKVYGMTGEGSNGTSTTQFWPRAAEIITLCKGMIYQDLQMAYTAGSYVDFQDAGKINISSLNGKFYFNVRRIGLQNKPVTVTLIPIQNITTVGAPVTIASLPNFNSVYKDSVAYTLPALSNGKSVIYAWKVETGGYTYYDTVLNVFNPSVLFTDNMETGTVSTKWTVGSSWAYTLDGAYTGSRSLAESPNNTNYTNSSTRLITSRTNLNLTSAKSAYLSFWVKHRCENFRDKLQVQVSTNGTTWVAVQGVTTIKEPGTADGSTINGISSLTGIRENWTKEVIDLRSYLGTAALRFRFQFTSNATSSYVYGVDKGFNIDDVIAISSPFLPNSLKEQQPVSLAGRQEENKHVLFLEIPNAINAQQYIIERSTNGVDYEFLSAKNARINSTDGLAFTDENPYLGENLYRAKIENTDGSFRYTNLVSLTAKQSTKVPTGIQTIFPNPTNGQIQVNFKVAEQQARYNLLVYNMSGQIVYNEALNLTEGLHNIQVDATNFAAGAYFISFSTPDSKISYESKFVKL
jgi:carboxypeptidase T